MNTNQILLAVSALGLGTLFLCLGILLMVNVKVRNWFNKWWFPMNETSTDKKRTKNFIQFVDGPLMILIGFLILKTALGMLGINF